MTSQISNLAHDKIRNRHRYVWSTVLGVHLKFQTCATRVLMWPFTWIAITPLICILLLVNPLSVPIGGYFWDTYIYPDAAWRIRNRQAPHIDFFAPAGALEYYSFALLAMVFPSGNSLLLAQWSLLLITFPVMAFIIANVPPRSRYLALSIVLPFVFFSIVPLNSKEVYPLAGMDGFGIYNRHVSLLIYVLVTAILFLRPGVKLAIILCLLMCALFLTKVTGAVMGACLLFYGLLSGRIDGRSIGIAIALIVAIFSVLDVTTGIISAYIRDIGILIDMNKAGLISRFRGPAIMYFDILAPMALLAILLLWIDRKRLKLLLSPNEDLKIGKRIQALFSHDSFMLVVLLSIGLFFETQNTGSLAFIFAWPLLALLFSRWHPGSRDCRISVLLLIGLTGLLMVVPMAHRTLRVGAAMAFYSKISEPSLYHYGNVEAREELISRAYAMIEHYAAAAHNYRELALAGEQASLFLYTEIDFQISWLISVSRAVDALRKWEAAEGQHLSSLIVLDFVDIFTPILRRQPVRLISIGMAPDRTVPLLEGKRLLEAQRSKAILVPNCPVTPVRLDLLETFKPLISDRRLIRLTPCWDLYVTR